MRGWEWGREEKEDSIRKQETYRGREGSGKGKSRTDIKKVDRKRRKFRKIYICTNDELGGK